MPTIHIRDLAKLVKRIFVNRPVLTPPYIFAFDKTKNPTQKKIVSAISKGIGTNEVDITKEDSITDEWKDFLTINLKMKTSKVFKDGKLPEDFEGENEEEELEKLKFPWHCQKGIPAKIRMLNEEFNETRGLKPVKVFVSGPPASGKTFFASKLAHYYNVPLI